VHFPGRNSRSVNSQHSWVAVAAMETRERILRKIGSSPIFRWFVGKFLMVKWRRMQQVPEVQERIKALSATAPNSAAVLSPPLILFSELSAVMFLLLLVLFWRHNQTATSVGIPSGNARSSTNAVAL
jgi:hypothetical protein